MFQTFLVSENIDSQIGKHRLAGTVKEVGREPYDEWVREHSIKDSRGPSERFGHETCFSLDISQNQPDDLMV